MGLMDALRHAEQQGRDAAHRGAKFARTGMQNAEASIRRNVGMKPHENRLHPPQPVSAHSDPEQEKVPTSKVRTGIVSVNGQDVGEMRCTGGRRTA